MKLYQVFASEGGYRFAGAIWDGRPILSCSPWFPTEELAQRAASEREQVDQDRYDRYMYDRYMEDR